jgi:hypothetical protein
VGDCDISEVDWILEAMRHYWIPHCLIQWTGNSHIQSSWAPGQNLANAQELVIESHQDHLRKP